MAIPPPPGMTPVNRVESTEVGIILSNELLPQHREDPNVLKFISSYLVCRDTKQASREAGISSRDGNTLKRRRDIWSAIVKITDLAVEKHGYDANEVIERVKDIMNVDIAEFENPDGTYKERLSDLPPETRRAVKKFKVKNSYDVDPNGMRVISGRVIEVELWDKVKAVELLGREKDIFVEKKTIRHDLTQNMSNVLLESTARAEERLRLMRDVTEESDE